MPACKFALFQRIATTLFGQKQIFTLIPVGSVLLALAGLVFVSGRLRAVASASKETPASPTVNAQLNIQRVEVEVITVRRDGMEPKEITRPMGRFILGVDNRSGLRDLALRLEGGPTRTRLERSIPSKKLAWRKALDLLPGNYTLSEASHPDWVCQITITAR
jgi:hypothetical protein